jgi:hypothetical protein
VLGVGKDAITNGLPQESVFVLWEVHMHTQVILGSVGAPVRYRCGEIDYFVGCPNLDQATVGELSLKHPQTGVINRCTPDQVAAIRTTIVCRESQLAGVKPVFRHTRMRPSTWWQMEVDHYPPTTSVAAQRPPAPAPRSAIAMQ